MCQVLCWVLEIQKYIKTDGSLPSGTNHTIECKSAVEEGAVRACGGGPHQYMAIREGFPKEGAKEGRSEW